MHQEMIANIKREDLVFELLERDLLEDLLELMRHASGISTADPEGSEFCTNSIWLNCVAREHMKNLIKIGPMRQQVRRDNRSTYDYRNSDGREATAYLHPSGFKAWMVAGCPALLPSKIAVVLNKHADLREPNALRKPGPEEFKVVLQGDEPLEDFVHYIQSTGRMAGFLDLVERNLEPGAPFAGGRIDAICGRLLFEAILHMRWLVAREKAGDRTHGSNPTGERSAHEDCFNAWIYAHMPGILLHRMAYSHERDLISMGIA